MKIAIVTDTNGGMSEYEANILGVRLIPMPVLVDGVEHFEGVDFSEQDLFSAMEAGKNVSTSQPGPAHLIELWEELLSEGYEEVIHIPMTSGLSGSCDAAKGLSMDFDGKVHVIDNHRISVTQYYSVLDAVQLAKEGKTGAEIKAYLEKTSYEATIYIAVNTLEYLKKGGRITPAVASIGSLLKIKPILTIQGDTIDSFAMARGKMDRCVDKMIEAVKKDIDARFQGKKYVVACAGAGISNEDKEAYLNRLEREFPRTKAVYIPLSASICTHTGPGAVGFGAACCL